MAAITGDCAHKLLLIEGETNANTVIGETSDEANPASLPVSRHAFMHA